LIVKSQQFENGCARKSENSQCEQNREPSRIPRYSIASGKKPLIMPKAMLLVAAGRSLENFSTTPEKLLYRASDFKVILFGCFVHLNT
jgi:hypothetical protein